MISCGTTNCKDESNSKAIIWKLNTWKLLHKLLLVSKHFAFPCLWMHTHFQIQTVFKTCLSVIQKDNRNNVNSPFMFECVINSRQLVLPLSVPPWPTCPLSFPLHLPTSCPCAMRWASRLLEGDQLKKGICDLGWLWFWHHRHIVKKHRWTWHNMNKSQSVSHLRVSHLHLGYWTELTNWLLSLTKKSNQSPLTLVAWLTQVISIQNVWKLRPHGLEVEGRDLGAPPYLANFPQGGSRSLYNESL